MVRILFLCVLLVNIVFFFWEYRKGAPEIYLPPSYENNRASESYAEKIMLSGEIPETRELLSEISLEGALPTQQSDPLSEAGNEILLIESRQAESAINETVQTKDSLISIGNDIGPLDESEELSDRESSQINQSVMPLSAKNATEEIDVKNNSPEQIKAEFTHTEQKSELDGLIETNSAQVSDEQVNINTFNTAQGSNLPLVVCYRLKAGEYTQNTFAQEIEGSVFKFELSEQPRDMTNYLVLTLVANSYQEVVSREQEMKQQGFDDLWVFKEGFFKWRISLGLFSGKEQANKAKELFSEQTNQVLEVVPNYQTISVTNVKISAREKQAVTAFEQKYSLIIDQKIACSTE